MSDFNVSAAVKAAVSSNLRAWASKYGPKSIDQAISSDTDTPLKDLLQGRRHDDGEGDFDGLYAPMTFIFGSLIDRRPTLSMGRCATAHSRSAGSRMAIEPRPGLIVNDAAWKRKAPPAGERAGPSIVTNEPRGGAVIGPSFR